MKLTEFCIRRPVTTAMFFIALIVLGFFSSARMPIDLFPQITFPALSVSTSYAGAGPEEIERLITIPIERAVSTVNRVKSIVSTSQEGSSRVTVNFDWGTDLDEAANDIRAMVDRVRRRLPDEAEAPVVSKFDPSMAPVMTLALAGRLEEIELREFAEEDLTYLLQRVDGVASVDVRGGKRREIKVFLKQDRLQALNLTADQIVNVIKNENASSPAGHLAVGVGDFLLRARGEYRNLADLRNLVVADRDGVPIYLRDIAAIEDGFEEIHSLVRIDGRPGIVISVSKRSGSNTVAVADRIYKALEEARIQRPEVEIRILNDDSLYIRRAVKSVRDACLLGGVLAALILLFFLHNWRATVITALAMPVSIMATLILAYFAKMTLNTISLGGLALGVGMLVDNSVVVLDNIFRHYHRDPGAGIAAAALSGTAEMGPAISASTLTTICVFFPLIFLTGRNGIIFKELSYMVIFSILCSLLVALTLVPMLCAKFLKVRDLSEAEENGIRGFLLRMQHGWEESYQKTLAWCLGHKPAVVLSCILVFLATVAFVPFIGSELVQETDEGIISINLQLPTGTRLEETDLHARSLEAQVKRLLPELENMEASVGGNQARLTLRLKDRTERRRTTQEIAEELQDKIRIPGARLRIFAQNSMRFLYGGSQFPIAVDIRGYDQELIRRVAYEVADGISAIPGLVNAGVTREEERPELSMVIDRKRAADYGVTAAEITSAIKTSIEGRIATVYREAGSEIQIRVSLQEADRRSWHDLGRILVMGRDNRGIPLTSLIDVIQTDSPVTIERKEQERNITVSAGFNGRDLAGVMADVRRVVEAIPRPPGVTIHLAGDYEEQQRSFREMLMAFILALLLVYMVMAAQFESFFDPLVIMFSIPFALSGVFTILLFTDTSFNTQVYLGLILLGGVVVNNAIVLISCIRILMERGLGLEEAVLAGARSRLRPILITTLTTLLALIPMALGLGEGSELQSPLARTVIGGLAFSTVLTLILIPVIFTGLEKMIAGIRKRSLKPRIIAAAVLILLAGLGLAPPSRAAETARTLTVTEAIALALQNSEEGRIIKQKRESAESAYRESMGDRGWQFSSFLEATVSQENSAKLGLDVDRSFASLAGRIAALNRKIALLETDLQEQNLIYAVVTAFQRELLAERDVHLAAESLARSRRFLEEVQTRSRLGLTSINDEIGAEAQVVAAETSLNRARQLHRLAQIKLRQFLNLDDDAQLILLPPPTGDAVADLETLLKEALTARADLQQARANQERAEVLRQLAEIAGRQAVTISWNLEREGWQTGISWTNQTGAEGAAGEWKLSGDLGLTWMEMNIPARNYPEFGTIRLTFKWNLFDGGAHAERVKQAESLLNQADEERKKLEKAASLEIQEAYYNLQYQQDRLRSSQMQLRYVSTQYEALMAKMRVGLVSVKEVLDAQLLLQSAELEYERAKSDLYLAGIALMKSAGKLSVTSLEEPRP